MKYLINGKEYEFMSVTPKNIMFNGADGGFMFPIENLYTRYHPLRLPGLNEELFLSTGEIEIRLQRDDEDTNWNIRPTTIGDRTEWQCYITKGDL
jgi:hypothetical protein